MTTIAVRPQCHCSTQRRTGNCIRLNWEISVGSDSSYTEHRPQQLWIIGTSTSCVLLLTSLKLDLMYTSHQSQGRKFSGGSLLIMPEVSALSTAPGTASFLDKWLRCESQVKHCQLVNGHWMFRMSNSTDNEMKRRNRERLKGPASQTEQLYEDREIPKIFTRLFNKWAHKCLCQSE